MSRYLAIAYSCEIAADPVENTVRHEEMIADLRREMFADRWTGCKVTRFQTHRGRAYVEIEPGVSPLTLDYLRSFRSRPVAVEEPQPQQQELSI